MEVDVPPVLAASIISPMITQAEEGLMDVDINAAESFDDIMGSPANVPGDSFVPSVIGPHIDNGQDIVMQYNGGYDDDHQRTSGGTPVHQGHESDSPLQLATRPIHVPPRSIYTPEPSPFSLMEESPMSNSESEECKGVEQLAESLRELSINDDEHDTAHTDPSTDIATHPTESQNHLISDNLEDPDPYEATRFTYLATLFDWKPFELSTFTEPAPQPEVCRDETWFVERLRELGQKLVGKRVSRQKVQRRTRRRRAGPCRLTPLATTTPVPTIPVSDIGDRKQPCSLDTDEFLKSPQDISDPLLPSSPSSTETLPPSPLAVSTSTSLTTPTEETCVFSITSFSSYETLSQLDPISSSKLTPTTPANENCWTQTVLNDEIPNPKVVDLPNDDLDPIFPGAYPIDELELSDSHPTLFSRIYPKHAPSLLQWVVESIFGW